MLSLCLLGFSAQAGVRYININATGSNDGSSWANAYTSLQSAISAATASDSLWMATGIYTPADTARWASFNMKSGVSIFGGFNGTESSFAQRNFINNPTILSGEINSPSLSSDNSIRILQANYLSQPITIDGVTIQGGSDRGVYAAGGQGIYIRRSVVTIRHCVISHCEGMSGPGVLADSATVTIDSSRIEYNQAYGGDGGGIYAADSKLNLLASRITSNIDSVALNGGGGLYVDGGDFNVDRCIFSGNKTTTNGCAIFASGDHMLDTVSNSLFVGNSSGDGGVVLLINNANNGTGASEIVYNCTFAHNGADISYDYNTVYLYGIVNRSFYNNILWENGEIWDLNNHSPIDEDYNLSPDVLLSGAHDTVGDPLFANPASGAAAAPFALGSYDYHLTNASPAIDRGSDTHVLSNFSRSLDGILRPDGAHTDVGAYEGSICLSTVSTHPIADSLVCDGKSATLSILVAGAHYQWQNGDTSGSITVSHPGTYEVSFIDAVGCHGSHSFLVTYYPDPMPRLTTMGDTIEVSGSYDSYQWYMNNTAHHADTTALITPHADGKYYVHMTDSIGCRWSSDTIDFIYTGIQDLQKHAAIFKYDQRNRTLIFDNHDARYDVEIHNSLGQMQQAQSNITGSYTLSKTLAPGIYYAQINGKGSFDRVKLLVE